MNQEQTVIVAVDDDVAALIPVFAELSVDEGVEPDDATADDEPVIDGDGGVDR